MKFFKKFSPLKTFLLLLNLFLLFSFCSMSQATEATFSWTPNSESNLAGYNIYIGLESSAYYTFIDVGIPEAHDNLITATLSSGFESGVTYYFTATAYDLDGFESDYSQEIAWTAPESTPFLSTNNDFNGDSREDILLWNNALGAMWLLEMNGN
ncbi:hypothetical protein KAR91_39165, partial [Candidatus Pacearchaeota archaeon]|nr:hypothetical protein [Candidatus Pacearchaeota archaeon]